MFAESVTRIALDLNQSLEVGALTWAIAQADLSFRGRPVPERLNDLHPGERTKYQDKAIEVLMSLNHTAVLYAELQAQIVIWEKFEKFCEDRGLDWHETHDANTDDALEVALSFAAVAAVKAHRQTLSLVRPGLVRHLERQERLRLTDSDPSL